jgi:hypothetical protein
MTDPAVPRLVGSGGALQHSARWARVLATVLQQPLVLGDAPPATAGDAAPDGSASRVGAQQMEATTAGAYIAALRAEDDAWVERWEARVVTAAAPGVTAPPVFAGAEAPEAVMQPEWAAVAAYDAAYARHCAAYDALRGLYRALRSGGGGQ